MKVKCKYTFSSIDHMHCDNLCTVLYAYLYAKHNYGTFIFQIDDINQQHNKDTIKVINSIFNKLELISNEKPEQDSISVPYIQSQHKDIYIKYVLQLVNKDKAYVCKCSKELDHEHKYCSCRDKYYSYSNGDVIKQKLYNTVGITTFNDYLRGIINFTDDLFED